MLLAGAFAAVLLIGLWCADFDRVTHRFDQNGLLALPHGTARFFPDVKRILFRPTYRLFALGFRTAWPLKGSLELAPADNGYRVVYTKRIPWSSAIITSLWFVLVGVGTIGFLVSYAAQGGFGSLSGVLLGVGVLALGLLVLAFGLVTITMAYRLEDSRLTQVYQELRAALGWSTPTAQSPPA
jgi:hypothetical protein